MRLGRKAVVVAAALAVLTAWRAEASTYEVERLTSGHKAAEASTWSVAGDMTPSGSFSLSASAADETPAVSEEPTRGQIYTLAKRAVVLEPGDYRVEAVFGALNGHADITGVGGAGAYVSVFATCPEGDCSNAVVQATTVLSGEVGMANKIENGGMVVKDNFRVNSTSTITLIAQVSAGATSGSVSLYGNDLAGAAVNSGTGFVEFSGIVQSLTLTPRPAA